MKSSAVPVPIALRGFLHAAHTPAHALAAFCRFRKLDFQKSVLERGCGFRAIDFRRQIDDSQELLGALLFVIVCPFFCSSLVSLLPLIVSRHGSRLTSRSLALKPGTSASTVSESSFPLFGAATG